MFNNERFLINKDYILRKVTQESIFLKYLGIEPNDYGSYINPLRDDKAPGCSFYMDTRGMWKFVDYAAGFNWDCFNIVEYSYNCSFKEAMLIIAGDFFLGDVRVQEIGRQYKPIKRNLELRVKRRKWDTQDFIFWKGLNEERLDWAGISPLSFAWFKDAQNLKVIYTYYAHDPCYCYWFGGYDYKLYFPFRQKSRFIHLKSDILQGYNQLPKFGKNLVITKSMKDVVYLSLFSKEFDLYSIAPMSETLVISKEQFTDLYNRFDNIITLFDFDRAGIKLARKYEKEYQLSFLFFGKKFKLQGVKDFTDYFLKYGIDKTRSLIDSIISNRNTQIH